MDNREYWENEYRDPTFLSLSDEPVDYVRKFYRFIKKNHGLPNYPPTILDFGCGNGRNLVYLVDRTGGRGIGIDISETAINIAKRLKDERMFSDDDLEFLVGGVERVEEVDDRFDIVLLCNVLSSLNPDDRSRLLELLENKMRAGGWVLFNGLVLDRDTNAKRLMTKFVGPDDNSYYLPDNGIVEWVYSIDDVRRWFSGFEIVSEKRFTGYQRFSSGRVFKRQYVTMYLRK